MKFLVMFKIFNSVIRFRIKYIRNIYKNSNRCMRTSRDSLWGVGGGTECVVSQYLGANTSYCLCLRGVIPLCGLHLYDVIFTELGFTVVFQVAIQKFKD